LNSKKDCGKNRSTRPRRRCQAFRSSINPAAAAYSKKTHDMDRLRQKLSHLVPKALLPFARRQVRVFDQIRNRRASQDRPGVVLMLHVGRCGSTVLANLLEQNPCVYWDGKLPRKAKQLYGEKAKRLDVARWTKRQFAISGDRFYGFEFKILADQYPAMLGTSTPEFLRVCKEIGVTHYVLLVRRNTLRHVVSHYASLARGSWHTSLGEPRPDLPAHAGPGPYRFQVSGARRNAQPQTQIASSTHGFRSARSRQAQNRIV